MIQTFTADRFRTHILQYRIITAVVLLGIGIEQQAVLPCFRNA
ncbi:Uncharacterised protein [Vibrio cholerae]|nr:Uncharacterised protein [Vibrio cholerae]